MRIARSDQFNLNGLECRQLRLQEPPAAIAGGFFEIVHSGKIYPAVHSIALTGNAQATVALSAVADLNVRISLEARFTAEHTAMSDAQTMFECNPAP